MILWMPLVAEQVWRLRKPVVLCGQSLSLYSEMSWVQFFHIMGLKKNLGFFAQKIICPGYSSIILSSAVEVAPYWGSLVPTCLFWMRSPLAISLNEIPIRCLISIVQSYSRYLLESWQFLFRVRVALHSVGMSDCSLLGISCIKTKYKWCFFSVGKLPCSDPMKSCIQCEYMVAFKYDIQISIHICCCIRTM